MGTSCPVWSGRFGGEGGFTRCFSPVSQLGARREAQNSAPGGHLSNVYTGFLPLLPRPASLPSNGRRSSCQPFYFGVESGWLFGEPFWWGCRGSEG